MDSEIRRKGEEHRRVRRVVRPAARTALEILSQGVIRKVMERVK